MASSIRLGNDEIAAVDTDKQLIFTAKGFVYSYKTSYDHEKHHVKKIELLRVEVQGENE